MSGGCPSSNPPYAALWKSSIWRIQLVSGFHLGKIWATILRSPSGRATDGKPSVASSTTQRRMVSSVARSAKEDRTGLLISTPLPLLR